MANNKTQQLLTPLELEAWSGFLVIHAAVARELDRRLAGRGTCLRVYDVLAVLDNAPDRRLRMKELARSLVLSPSRGTRVVGELEEAGHVAREPDPDDGRVIWASLTPAGVAALQEARAGHHEDVRELFTGQLDDEQLRELAGAWARLRPVFEEACERAEEACDEADAACDEDA